MHIFSPRQHVFLFVHTAFVWRVQIILWKHFIVFEICFLLQPLMADTWPRKSRMKVPTAATISHNIAIFEFSNKNIYERTKMSFHHFDSSHAKQLQTEKFQELNCQRSLGSTLEFIILDSYFISIFACIDMDTIWIYPYIHPHTSPLSLHPCVNVQEADRLHSRSRSSLAFPWVHPRLPILKIQAKLLIKKS